MSNFGATKDSAAQKADETKGFGQQKAGEAHQATKVRLMEKRHRRFGFHNTADYLGFISVVSLAIFLCYYY